MIIYIGIIVTYVILMVLKSNKVMHMFQQNLYNEDNRYITWLTKNFKSMFDFEFINIFLIVIYLFVYNNIILLLPILVINLMLFIKWNYINKSNQNKIKLNITKRLRRLIISFLFFFLLFNAIIMYYYGALYYVMLYISIVAYFLAIIIILINIINKPIEKLVFIYYYKKTRNKLNKMDNLKVIGITGSYGKTSSKNILNDILNIKYNSKTTRKNFNTPYGLIITVNEDIDKFDDIFIAEMGACAKGRIKKLCDLVKPKYGMLTTIGVAHLDTFGSEQNIINGKFELIESLPEDGFAVLNMDDPKQVSYKLKNKVEVNWISINNDKADLRAINIKGTSFGTTFDVLEKKTGKKYSFETKLLGIHSVYNILAGIMFGIKFGISIEKLQLAVKKVKPVEHRLELKKIGNFYQIDDAYNSNPVGAKAALDVLDLMNGIKIVVTPGMIELKDKEHYYNKEFGKQIAKVADYVILIGEKRTLPIYEGLKEENYPEEKIIIYNNVKQSYEFINKLKVKNDIYALYENDLPDIYNE